MSIKDCGGIDVLTFKERQEVRSVEKATRASWRKRESADYSFAYLVYMGPFHNDWRSSLSDAVPMFLQPGVANATSRPAGRKRRRTRYHAISSSP